jgi:SAM-dependent methyltransferase
VSALATAELVEPISDLEHARTYVGNLARGLDRASRYVRELLELIDSCRNVPDLEAKLRGGRAHQHAGEAFFRMSLSEKLMASVLTAETKAFRFSAEEEEEILSLIGRPRRGPIRILSAPCSRGFEAISLAAYAVKIGVRFDLLAIDIQPALVRDVQKALLDPVFDRDRSAIAQALETGAGRIDGRAGDLFELELGTFDLVVCRNLLGYFLPTRALELLRVVSRHVAPGGALLLDDFCLGKMPALATWLEARAERRGGLPLYGFGERAPVE